MEIALFKRKYYFILVFSLNYGIEYRKKQTIERRGTLIRRNVKGNHLL